MKKLFMTIGISGSGKSTYLKKRFKPETIICPDSIRKELTGNIANHTMEPVIWATATKRVQDALDKYGVAVLDATNVNASYRRGFLTPFKKVQDVERIALVFPTSAEMSKQRVAADLKNKVDRSPVPDTAIDRQLKDFERGRAAIAMQFDRVEEVPVGEQRIQLKNLILEIMK